MNTFSPPKNRALHSLEVSGLEACGAEGRKEYHINYLHPDGFGVLLRYLDGGSAVLDRTDSHGEALEVGRAHAVALSLPLYDLFVLHRECLKRHGYKVA